MEINDSLTVTADRERVWAFLMDVERLAQCVPGVESVEEVGDSTYLGKLKVKVGPIMAAFNGKATITETDPSTRLVALIEGDDKSSGSTVKATFVSMLSPTDGDGTRIDYEMDVNLRGRLAQFGLTVVKGTAKKMTAQFGRCVQATLAEEALA
jgi:carbon monoxide dehydrogenase subunit G